MSDLSLNHTPTPGSGSGSDQLTCATLTKVRKMEEEIMRKELELQAIKAELREGYNSHMSTETDYPQNQLQSIFKSLGKAKKTFDYARVRSRTKHESMVTNPMDTFMLRSLRQSP